MKKYVEPKAQIVEYGEPVMVTSGGHNIPWQEQDWYGSSGEGN